MTDPQQHLRESLLLPQHSHRPPPRSLRQLRADLDAREAAVYNVEIMQMKERRKLLRLGMWGFFALIGPGFNDTELLRRARLVWAEWKRLEREGLDDES